MPASTRFGGSRPAGAAAACPCPPLRRSPPPAAVLSMVALALAVGAASADAAGDAAPRVAGTEMARAQAHRVATGRVRRLAAPPALRFSLRDARGRDRRLLARGATARRLARLAGRRVTVKGPVVRLGPRRRGLRVIVVRSLRFPSRRAAAPPPPPAPPAPAPPLAVSLTAPALGPLMWTGDFETGDLSQWLGPNGGTGVQAVAEDRIRVVRSPVAQGAYAARFEVRKGDYWRGSGGNRAELMHWTGEREGDERWYSWSTMFAPDYPSVTTGFQIVTQWHADAPGTQPTIVVYASGDRIGFRTTEANADGSSSSSKVHWTGPMNRGDWHTFVLRVRWSATGGGGFVELWHDGARVVSRTPARTLVPGRAIYMKQGLYRAEHIVPPAVVYHDGAAMHAS